MRQHNHRFALLLLFAVLVFPLSPPAFSMDWPEVAARIHATYASTNALLSDEAVRAQTRTLALPGSPTVSVTPGAKAITPVDRGSFGQEIDDTATVTDRLPVGLSEMQRENPTFAPDASCLSVLNPQKTEADTYVKLYPGY